MNREIIREEPGCTIWEVTGEDDSVSYQVLCGVHRVISFTWEVEAQAHFDRWAPEVAHDIATFDK